MEENKAPPAEAPLPASADPDSAPPERHQEKRRGLMLPSFAILLSLGIVAWLVHAWSGYANKNPPSVAGMQVGNTSYVEITLVREDAGNLACASDVDLAGYRCGFRANGEAVPGLPESMTLLPYNTINNELFLGAGLWSQPVMRQPLPSERFSVLCEFRIVGALKQAQTRWTAAAAFIPAGHTLVAGVLANCVLTR